MKDLIRMNQLAGIITESQAKKIMAVLNEEANTDLELKSKAKEVFSILKKHNLKPNYNGKLDKATDSALVVSQDKETGEGLITVNIWAWAVNKNKVNMKELNSDIVQALGGEFENKSGETAIGNDKVYRMLIRKK